jgi:CobQ-like glutamine amidotransferase family enzyme
MSLDSTGHNVRLCHLYPGLMNIYADRGNIAVFERRLGWRGIGLEITEVSIGDELVGDFDLYYLGGGQDRDQDLVADDLQTKAAHMRAAADDGAAQLYVCGGIQLAGHGYVASNGDRLPGTGVLDLETTAGDNRLIGDLVIDAHLPTEMASGETRQIVGYENHAGRTSLGSGCQPLGRVVNGHGNDGASGFEGACRDRVIGTYLHGPLLPKNPWLADVVLGWALAHRYGDGAVELEPIDDSMEQRAHAAAVARANRDR